MAARRPRLKLWIFSAQERDKLQRRIASLRFGIFPETLRLRLNEEGGPLPCSWCHLPWASCAWETYCDPCLQRFKYERENIDADDDDILDALEAEERNESQPDLFPKPKPVAKPKRRLAEWVRNCADCSRPKKSRIGKYCRGCGRNHIWDKRSGEAATRKHEPLRCQGCSKIKRSRTGK